VGAISDASMQVPSSAPRDLVEMVDNALRPTASPSRMAAYFHRQRRRADRRHHVVHQHVESRRPACGGPARQEGRRARPEGEAHIKTSLAPARACDRLSDQGRLLPYLEQLGFGVAAYGCTTCIGNAGDLAPEFNDAIVANDLICAAVLSGNRNFEARIHPNLKANFLASPPLVVAYAIAGTVLRDLTTEPLGIGNDGTPVFLKDIWPTSHEIAAVLPFAREPATFRKLYGSLATANPLWGTISGRQVRSTAGRHRRTSPSRPSSTASR
jgi:aconitase A